MKTTDSSNINNTTIILLNNEKNINNNKAISGSNLDTNPNESPYGLASENKEGTKEI